ncbi:hypothetical protein HETIRDRAFT_455462 [Heterobasidion irregulare TC 32-1]|uniref:Uncharacterized protein n=1 Tax=Heterobasidion irregulare (strain TC 32-1) TaxID=747525 RepID=W4JSF1_HETIT|nr:uncharacterized protein HETIRDRAFT_455462 [Heterobasidion irregulare TC 32-1]ETW75781.1 hypothetical protein HETIRDRAFT_455462 [Heterobasidion irregulare TC 32-1]
MVQQKAELEQKISELQIALAPQNMWMQDEMERKVAGLQTLSSQAAVRANKGKEHIEQENNADNEDATAELLPLNSHIESQMFMESVISQTLDALNWEKLYRRIEKAQERLAWTAGLVDNISNRRVANIGGRADTERLAVAKGLFTGSADKEASAFRLLNSPAGYLVVERFFLVRKGRGSIVDEPVVDQIGPHMEGILLLTSFVRDPDYDIAT